MEKIEIAPIPRTVYKYEPSEIRLYLGLPLHANITQISVHLDGTVSVNVATPAPAEPDCGYVNRAGDVTDCGEVGIPPGGYFNRP